MKTGSHMPEIKGWCPGALRPMQSGDGLVVRVRPRGGRLSPQDMRGIADLSARFGNGLIDLSARANVQLRGVSAEGHPDLIAGLRALGMIDASADAEARRNIVVSPFHVPGDGMAELAQGLAEALVAPDAPQTPGKFGYAVDCGPVPVLRDISADIRLERGEDSRIIVRADGAGRGRTLAPEAAVEAALDLARWFLSSGGVSGGRGRMAAHLNRAPLPARFATEAAPAGQPFAPAPGPVPQGLLVGFEFGQMQAETLAALADAGPVRVTPWRMLLIEGAARAPDLPGLITHPDDPMLRVIACTGAPGCPQGLAPTRPLARALAPHLADGGLLHLSGCAKGCTHPAAAPLTLVARDADRFDLIRHGTASDTPHHRDLTPGALIANPAFLTE